jgi:hypothetical protein
MFGAIVGQIFNLHLAARQPKTPCHQGIDRILDKFTMGRGWGYSSGMPIDRDDP